MKIVAAVIIACVVLIVSVALYGAKQHAECEAKGGIFVVTQSGVLCLDRKAVL